MIMLNLLPLCNTIRLANRCYFEEFEYDDQTITRAVAIREGSYVYAWQIDSASFWRNALSLI